MATPNAPLNLTLVTDSLGNKHPILGYKDGNGAYAHVMSEWLISNAGILIPKPVDSNDVPQNSLSTGGSEVSTSNRLPVDASLSGSNVPTLIDGTNGFILIKSGTIDVTNGGTQHPNTGIIPRPSSVPENYGVLVDNESGLTVSGINVYAYSTQVPNLASGKAILLESQSVSLNTASQTSMQVLQGSNLNVFIGDHGMSITFNLSAAPTAAGTINWALIGY